MTDTEPFALIVLLTAAVGLVAVLSNRLTERVKIPSPALVLVGAAIAVKVIPDLHAPPDRRSSGWSRSPWSASCSTAACTSAGPGSGPPPPRSRSSASSAPS